MWRQCQALASRNHTAMNSFPYKYAWTCLFPEDRRLCRLPCRVHNLNLKTIAEAGGHISVVEYLDSILKALGLIPSIALSLSLCLCLSVTLYSLGNKDKEKMFKPDMVVHSYNSNT